MIKVKIGNTCGFKSLRIARLSVAVMAAFMAYAATAYGGSFHLKNEALTVGIGSRHGDIQKIYNHLTGEKHKVSSLEFTIVTADQGSIRSDQMTVDTVQNLGSHLVFRMHGGGFQAELHYELGKTWLEKWVVLQSSKSVHLNRIIMGDRRFSKPFQEVLRHTDNTVYNVPINCFLRSNGGGVYAGIAWPFTEAIYDQKGISLAFGGWQTSYDKRNRGDFSDITGDRPYLTSLAPMNVVLSPGKPFVTEREFLGVFKKTGLLRKKEIIGIPRILTTLPETLDWGEVWAMQEYMEHALPPLRRHHDGYWYYLNGWWAGTPGTAITPKDLQKHLDAMDKAKELGAEVYALSPTWMGMAQFFRPSEEFVRSVGKDGTVHFSPEVKKVVAHARELGLGLAPYCEGLSYYREDRPDWKLIQRDGKSLGWLCWANPDASKWFINLHEWIFSQYPEISYWNWDGGWLPSDPPGGQPWDCMSDSHGHRAGNIGYLAYKNVMEGWNELHEKYPHVGLGTAWAHKAGNPWATRSLDVIENLYENPGPDDLRFQAWFVQNSSFIPPSKNMAQIWFRFEPSTFLGLKENMRSHWIRFYMEKGYRNYEYCLMSALSIGSNIGFIVQFPEFKTDKEKQVYLAFMKKWKKWASDNIDYLRIKRDLFGVPLRGNGLDGSAHIIKDRGFIFLFNPTTARHIGSIPLNDLIHLTVTRDQFDIREIYPDSKIHLGTYSYGENLLVAVEPGTCRVLGIKPHHGEMSPKVVPEGVNIQPAFQAQ